MKSATAQSRISGLKKLSRGFYLRPTLRVAQDILGSFLVRKLGHKILVGRIVEVEAYLGAHDPASHAYRGITDRNEVMFRKGGHLYVYFTYGMHFCSNVVTEKEGTGHAVLLRAVEPVLGLATMQRNRKLTGSTPITQLCNGPAKLCKAFGISRKDNGTDLCGDRIWLARNTRERARHLVKVTTRVGISSGKQHRWRFLIKGSPFVSPGRPVNE